MDTLEDDKYLDPSEILALETDNFESQLRVQEQRYLNLKKQNLQLQIDLLSANILVLENNMLTKLNIHKNKAGNQKKFIAELCERYEIKDSTNFGYDPISGKLHTFRSE